jgi:hypothetical protein
LHHWWTRWKATCIIGRLGAILGLCYLHHWWAVW